MNLKQSFIKKGSAFLLPAALMAVAMPAQAQQQQLTQLKPVAPTRQNITDLGLVSPSEESNVTVFLNMHNKPAFDAAVEALYDPSSPTYRKWMTGPALVKYAPTAAEIATVQKELEKHGLTILSVDPDNLSVRAHGTTANLEAAFQTHIHQYSLNGKTFKANVEAAHLTGAAGSLVAQVSGLEQHHATPMTKYALNPHTNKPYAPIALAKVKAAQASGGGLSNFITADCFQAPTTSTYDTPGASLPVGVYYGNGYTTLADATNDIACDYTPAQLQQHYGLPAAYAAGIDGRGKTVVLLEAYGYPSAQADANAFSQLTGLPPLTASNFQIVYPQGPPVDPNAGVLLGWDGEIALDIQWAHSIAPGAKIVVVAASGQDNEDFQDAIRYITTHGIGHAVSNSWELDTDIIAGAAEQQSYDEVLEFAAAAGVDVNFSSGDAGDEGLGSPKGAPGVPSVDPWATAVGGTAIINIPGSTSHQEVGWGNNLAFINGDGPYDPPFTLGFLGGAGGGESIYWAKPAFQAKLPGTGRQVPDVAALADPYTGVPLVLTVSGTQYLEVGVGGTSLASPIFTAIWTLATQASGEVGLGNAARIAATLPANAITDIRPAQVGTNVAGTIFDSNGSTAYSSAQIFEGYLYNQVTFTDANWPLDSEDNAIITFGTDSSLTVTQGWDNVTGYGAPHGLAFIKAAGAPAPAAK
jgi:subtilase family serine protease